MFSLALAGTVNTKEKKMATENTIDAFGENVFTLKKMKSYISGASYAKLVATVETGAMLDESIADDVANAMKEWAMSNGATHYTHWFQPLTGSTAEKHDSFIFPDFKGGVVTGFSGEELIQGEPDASSFPNGGLRATFEARGYTAWDPTSPAFIKYDGAGAATLCIPTAFCGYNGEALDKKTPLLRATAALAKQLERVAGLFGLEVTTKAYSTLGSEQEYFLIDRDLYNARLDLKQCGRTLFGRSPAKHQQLDDHYFGAIKPRVAAFMADLDAELWRMGIPAKTRHNEVCPGQFEIAPVFQPANLAIDQNLLTMETLGNIAERHDFACLLHEKPFAGVNGSGKHNNWSICGPDGKNWLSPGANPHENAKFMMMVVALMKAVDTHADLMRASVASAGNDHRLGANEAPPAVVSIFLGDCLNDVVEQIEAGGATSSKDGGFINLGTDSLPKLPRGSTDRNRTSPFAFTGNRFEFRATGSAQNASGCNVVINTIMAEALDVLCTKIEAAMATGTVFETALQDVLAATITEHKRILFNGDGYTGEWLEEAARRGLPNLKTTPDALVAFDTDKARDLFAKYGVLSNRELHSRFETYTEVYETMIKIESGVAVTLAMTEVLPATVEAITMYSGITATQGLADEMNTLAAKLIKGAKALEAAEGAEAEIVAMVNLRATVDSLEAIVPAEFWPMPSYAEMLFI
jgi:glutamine synthetase